MPPTMSQRVPFVILCALALSGAIYAQAPTAPAASVPAAAPASPSSPTKVTLPEEAQWSAVGATAQCRDGTYFHDKVDGRSCAAHGGIRRLLQVRGQDLIR